VEGVGALLRHRVDDARDGGAVFGVELVGDDLELLDRLERRARLRSRAAAAEVVVVAPTIHQEHHAAAVLAVDRHAVGVAVSRGVVDDARQQCDEAGEVARQRRQIGDLTRSHVPADLRRRQIHLRRLARHRDRLGERAHLEGEIDGHGRADLQPHVACELSEAFERRGDLVRAGDDSRNEESAVAGGHRFAEGSALLVRDDDGDAREDGVLWVYDTATYRGASLLRFGGDGEGHERGAR
jgi:hypothetical protein